MEHTHRNNYNLEYFADKEAYDKNYKSGYEDGLIAARNENFNKGFRDGIQVN